jgi:hypothetical protein
MNLPRSDVGRAYGTPSFSWATKPCIKMQGYDVRRASGTWNASLETKMPTKKRIRLKTKFG